MQGYSMQGYTCTTNTFKTTVLENSLSFSFSRVFFLFLVINRVLFPMPRRVFVLSLAIIVLIAIKHRLHRRKRFIYNLQTIFELHKCLFFRRFQTIIFSLTVDRIIPLIFSITSISDFPMPLWSTVIQYCNLTLCRKQKVSIRPFPRIRSRIRSN